MHSQILTKLDGATRAFHAPSDEPWLALVDVTRTITRVDYARHLIERYGFEAPLEAALAYTPQLGFILDTHHRFRAGMLAQDLLELGLSAGAIAAIPQCMIAPFTTPVEALGWLYVHERCTLLFEHVALHLRDRLPDLDNAMSYLRSNHKRIGAAWEEFGQALDGAITTEELEDQLIRAARDAFQAGRRWQVRAFLENRLN